MPTLQVAAWGVQGRAQSWPQQKLGTSPWKGACSELWVTEHRLLTASKPRNFRADFAFLSCSAVCSAVPTVNIPKVSAINILIQTQGGGEKAKQGSFNQSKQGTESPSNTKGLQLL